MALASYDAHFGLHQDQLARNGGQEKYVKKMSKEEYGRFLKSPAMQKQAHQEEQVEARTSKRDKRRMETDPEFHPKDSDWSQPKAFNYDRQIDYYRVLGIDEYETLEGVKKAYRRLSLVYHPDKTRGLDQATKDEYQHIFIELHGGYLTLGDNPTRRQYDRDRDNQAVLEELYGQVTKKKEQFDAFVELEKRAKKKSKPAVTIEVPVKVKLEKMFFGGIKVLTRNRKKEAFGGFETELTKHELVLPPRCVENYSYCQRHAGDHHEEHKPDHLNFKMRMKPHPKLVREGDDLRLKQNVTLHKGALVEPYSSVELEPIKGRALLLFGRNPFYGRVTPASGRLHVKILGEAFGGTDGRAVGSLAFQVDYPGDETTSKAKARVARIPLGVNAVRVTHRESGNQCCVMVNPDTQISAVIKQLAEILDLPDANNDALILHKKLVYSDGLGARLLPQSKVGTVTDIFCLGQEWSGPKLQASRCNDLIIELQAAIEKAEEAFLQKHSLIIQATGEVDASQVEPPVEIRNVLQQYGFVGSRSGLERALEALLEQDNIDVRADAKVCMQRCRALAVGEAGGVYEPPKRRLAAEKPLHPVLRRRAERLQHSVLECHAELRPLGATLDLATWPSSRLEFYSNLGQQTLRQDSDRTSVVRQRPLYGIVLSCPHGAKKHMQEAWSAIKWATLPLLVQTLWMLLRPARSLMPRALHCVPACFCSHDEEAAEVPRMPFRSRERTRKRPKRDVAFEEFTLRFRLGPPSGIYEESSDDDSTFGYDFDQWDVPIDDMNLDIPLYPRAVARPPRWQRRDWGHQRPVHVEGTTDSESMLWHRLGDDALASGHAWVAYRYFSRAAAEAGFVESVAALQEDSEGSAVRIAVPEKRLAFTWHPEMRLAQRPEIHRAELTLAQARAWCADNVECRGFCFRGSPYTTEPVEISFKSRWAVEQEGDEADAWTACRVEDAIARALARRADCLLHVDKYSQALQDAQAAAQLQPNWGGAWRRVGLLAAKAGQVKLAHRALAKAIELEPGDVLNVETLQKYNWCKADMRTAAREEKQAGNTAFKEKPAVAVSAYTSALAAMQVVPNKGIGSDSNLDESEARLASEILSNRSAVFAKLCQWTLAIADAERAVAMPGRQDWARGAIRLGTALLGAGRLEEAYSHFRRIELLLPDRVPADHPAKLGTVACISQAPLWKHLAGRERLAKFWQDGRRSTHLTRVFAVSDVHFDHPGNDVWVSSISNTKFQEDVLIIAGNIGESLFKLKQGLRYLRCKFRRVFFTPGNRDLWIHPSEEKDIPDSIAKLFSVLALCDELNVDVFPAAVGQGIFVVPLFSWYNADFDEDDPFASQLYDFDKPAKWPMDKDNYVWRYMLYLNRRFLELPYPGQVITFSHFLPRSELPYWGQQVGTVKAVGCPQLDPQIRQVKSKCHIFGRSQHHFSRAIEGVRYVQCSLADTSLRPSSIDMPIRCIFNGAQGGPCSYDEPIS